MRTKNVDQHLHKAEEFGHFQGGSAFVLIFQLPHYKSLLTNLFLQILHNSLHTAHLSYLKGTIHTSLWKISL